MQSVQVGGLQDDYVLGSGDEIDVIFRGHEDAAYVAIVDRDGRLILPELPPIAAAGRTLGEVKREIAERTARVLIGSQAFVSVGTVRQISVMVTGEVPVPGMRTVTGLSTPLDAILLSGGIKKTGSLRDVVLFHGGRRVRLDLYALLKAGADVGARTMLSEGDRIFVPPIGATVAVAGSVKTPAIYELAPGRSVTTASALIAMAGGVELPGAKRLSKVELLNDGRTTYVPLTPGGTIHPGEALVVDFDRMAANGSITLFGEVALPGTRALSTTSSVSQLIRDTDDLTPQSYTVFAIVVRREPASNFRVIVPFSIQRTFSGQEDLKLSDNDEVYVFNRSEIAALAAAASATFASASSSSANPLSNAQAASGPTTIGAIMNTAATQANETAVAGAAAATAGQAPVSLDQIAANLGIPTIVLVNAARDYLVSISGEVRNPGSYLAAGEATLDSLVSAAGGLQNEADLSAVEITSTVIDAKAGTSRTVRDSVHVRRQDFSSIALKPLDTVRLRRVFSDHDGATVTILGQVRYPGTFDIGRGETLSSVLARAGGLTAEAYPEGTVFTRTSAAIEEADGNQRTARLLEDNIATAATLPSALINASGLSYIQQIAQVLRNMPALGRISVTADPAILATKREADILLQTGDAIYVPKRPTTVTVTGDVLNNGAFPCKPGFSVSDYIRTAGGEAASADDSLVFIVLPDGSARPANDSVWRFGATREIPPGSMIVVPRNPQPFNVMAFSLNLTDVLSKLASTAAALVVIQRR